MLYSLLKIRFFYYTFREDISFHFSLGFTALMRRFTGNKTYSSRFMATRFFQNSNNLVSTQSEESLLGDRQRYQYQKEEQQTSINASSNLNTFAPQNEQMNNLLVALQGFQIIASKSNVVLIVVGGVMWRGLGWKILAITGSLYGLYYLYERLMWTRKTQEKLFKRQYADYASSKLKLIVDLTSQNAACQVQQYVK
jgi:hypothetical protein